MVSPRCNKGRVALSFPSWTWDPELWFSSEDEALEASGLPLASVAGPGRGRRRTDVAVLDGLWQGKPYLINSLRQDELGSVGRFSDGRDRAPARPWRSQNDATRLKAGGAGDTRRKQEASQRVFPAAVDALFSVDSLAVR